jgi:asparagine synthase (glutamine-hydrolysing)
MCGIVGILRKDCGEVSTDQLTTMSEALAHRGPDGSATWLCGPVGIGHRRLAIIDLETGAQPMSDMARTTWITFNGEIYNFRELKVQLGAKGHRFRTASDTEVILAAYREWGENCVTRLRGMFAFCIADLEAQKLILARDHLGIKPLFWMNTPDVFAFASEIQGLRQVAGATFDLDLDAVDHYLRLQYIPAPHSAFRQISKLPPAHCMSVGFDGKISEPRRYWTLSFEPNRSRSEDEWVEILDETLRSSVESHLVSDVPLGAFLSGGLDSSAVVAYMAQVLHQPVRTFTIGFEEETFDETVYAATVSKRWGTDHHVEILRPDALEILPSLVRHYGEPFGDSSSIPTYYLSRMAANVVPMVLSGDGGDELFAGYNSYRHWIQWMNYAGTAPWKRVVYPFANALFPDRYPSRRPDLDSWMQVIQCFSNCSRRRLWRHDLRHHCLDSVELFETEFARISNLAPIQRAQSMDVHTYLPFAILTKVDTAAMISSLEVRTPFVDCKVAEFVATVPPELNFRIGDRGMAEGKLLLKRLLARYYPGEFVKRPKMGFGVPIERWFGASGSLHETVNERLLDPTARINELFEANEVRRLLKANAANQIWLLLFLEEWLQQNPQSTPAA